MDQLLTVTTGFVLLWNASGGLQGAWLISPTGLAFSIGGIAGVIALEISFPISLTLSKLYYLTDDTGLGPTGIKHGAQPSRNTTNG